VTTVLPAEVAVLLPRHDEAPRCAEFTKDIGSAPRGTALDVSMVVLVETPLPWPKPVFEHELFGGMSNTFDSPVGRARILATSPLVVHDDRIAVTCFWRTDHGTSGVVLIVRDTAQLHECLADLQHSSPSESPFASDGAAPDRAVIVCTQGSHDICCGSEGTRLAAVLELTRPDLAVYRVSHLGGHRFAPTVLTLPDGRMWAHPTADDIVAIVDRSVAPSEVVEQCRGWWGAAGGAAQAAEVEVFGTQPWIWDDRIRAVSVIDDLAIVESEGEAWTVAVSVERMVPTIACRADGGLPAKVAPEYDASILEHRRLD
jgi:hypothetical protein